MPATVDAHMAFGKWHDIEVEDDVTAFVTYPNGATGVFVTSTGDAPGTNRFEITLDKGKLVAENGVLTLWEAGNARTGVFPHKHNPVRHAAVNPPRDSRGGRAAQHVGVLNAFAGAILRGEPLIAPGQEGIRGLTISNAMHLSAWLGHEVPIPFDEDLFYSELMKRVKTSRRKEHVSAAVADLSGTYGGAKS